MISHIQALKARFNLVGRESVMRRASALDELSPVSWGVAPG